MLNDAAWAESAMRRALDAALTVRSLTSPNPWVGAVVLSADGRVAGIGATSPDCGPHAEVHALVAAGPDAQGGTLVVTLEPCAHYGRNPPCTEAVLDSGVRRVVIGMFDPDVRVSGRGVAALEAAGLEVITGVLLDEIAVALMPYLTHRRTGRPNVICKLGVTLDGTIACADGSSQWITGKEARADAHRLRAESDAILVGAATVRRDDPSLTVRHVSGRDPLRVVLGTPPANARVQPCLEWTGALTGLLDHLGSLGILQLLVEGGARTVRSFLDLDLVDKLVLYVAPALCLGRDGVPMVAGPSVPTVADLNRMHFGSVRRLGDDLRIEVIPPGRSTVITQHAADSASTWSMHPGGNAS